MASYKHLIGTPLDRNKRKQNNNAYQFTPIGHQDSDLEFSILQESNHMNDNNNIRHSSTSNNKLRDDQVKLDNTFDTFNTSTPLASFNSSNRTRSMNDKENVSPSKGKYDDFLRNTSNPLKQQEEYINGLKTENYGLKVKINSLTKYLNLDMSAPENVKNLINENSELKSEINKLTLQLEELKSSTTTTGTTTSNMNFELNTLRNEKEELLSKVERFEKERATLLERLEKQDNNVSAHNENDDDNDLIMELQHQVEDLQYELRAKAHEIEEKDLNIDQLQKSCKNFELDKSEDLKENDKLEEELIDKNEEIKQLSKDNEDLSQENYQLNSKINENETKLNNLKAKMLKLESDNSNLKLKLKSLEGNGSSTSKKVDKLLKDISKKSNKINELTNTVRELQSQKTIDDNEILKLESLINSLENQINSGSSHYNLENEISRLRSVENNLRNELSHCTLKISELQADLQESQNSLIDNSSFLSDVQQIERERDEAYEDLKIYETHILELESKLDEAIEHANSLSSDSNRLNQEIINLKNQNNSLKKNNNTKVHFNNEKLNDHNNNKSKGFFSSFWNSPTDVDTDSDEDQSTRATSTIKKLTKEKDELHDKIKTYELKIKHLNEDLTNERNHNKISSIGSYEKEEIKKLSKQKNDLEVLMDNKKIIFETQLSDYKERINQLDNKIQMKDSELESIKLELSKQKLENNTKHQTNVVDLVGKEEYLKTLKENMEKEKKIMELNMEVKKIKDEQEVKTTLLNKEIESLKTSLANSIEQPTSSDKFKKQLEEQNNELKSNKNKLSEINGKYNKLKRDYKKIHSRYKASRNHDDELTDISIELNDNKQNDRLINKLEAKEMELLKLNNDYNSMKKKLNSKIEELIKNKSTMRNEIEEISNKFDKLKLQNNSDKFNEKLQDTVLFYREKFHQQLYLSKDLHFMNDYLTAIMKKSNKQTMKDVNKLLKACGNYPNIESLILSSNLTNNLSLLNDNKRIISKNSNQKLTFKTLGLFVLAMVRIKNRTNRSLEKSKALKVIENNIMK